jgi:hypothetical protein
LSPNHPVEAEALMSVRSVLAAAVLAASLAPAAPALAADVVGPPVVFQLCAPPPAAVAAVTLAPNYRSWWKRGDHPRIVFVERYDPHNPPPVVVPKYVIPQYAYLASSLCDFPEGVSPRSWYDGKLFYIPGGNRAAPDSFMVIERK